MRFLDLCEKEVVSVEEGRYIGHVRDLEFDPVCGKICAIIVPGPGKYMGIFCRDYEYCIPWVKIVKIRFPEISSSDVLRYYFSIIPNGRGSVYLNTKEKTYCLDMNLYSGEIINCWVKE